MMYDTSDIQFLYELEFAHIVLCVIGRKLNVHLSNTFQRDGCGFRDGYDLEVFGFIVHEEVEIVINILLKSTERFHINGNNLMLLWQGGLDAFNDFLQFLVALNQMVLDSRSVTERGNEIFIVLLFTEKDFKLTANDRILWIERLFQGFQLAAHPESDTLTATEVNDELSTLIFSTCKDCFDLILILIDDDMHYIISLVLV